MIREAKDHGGVPDWGTTYEYTFRVTGKLEDFQGVDEETLIDILLSGFETNLKIKLGYTYEGKWVKK